MEKITIETQLDVFDSVSELPSTIKKLMSKAQQARDNAYAPYSRFKVGAAVLLETSDLPADSDPVICGNNQENAAFPSGLCAERVAVFYAGATYPGATIKAIALTVKSLSHTVETPTPPCGACRQVLAEYEVNQKSPISIYFMGEKGKVVKASSIKDLLPLIFDNSFL